MTKEQIIHNSKLIAKYLGWKYQPFEKDAPRPAGWYKPIQFKKGEVRTDDQFWEKVCRNHKQLRFYDSFDSLIPAIKSLEREDLSEKINNFEYVEFERCNFQCEISILRHPESPIYIGEGKGEGIVKDTFKAVSEAIKYINKLKNEQ